MRDASKTLELDEHLERKPGNLSGGQRQRVAMGRAIVRDAEAFLFDEPLSNLDAKLRGQMRTEIARLQRRLGITTVYVTHDQTEAMTLGDRVAVLKRGHPAAARDARASSTTSPVNLFVAGFIGTPPMNFLPATVEGNQVKLPFGTVTIPEAKAEKAQGKGLLIAGIRPEHFEDAAVMDSGQGTRARRSRPPSTSSSGSATRPTPTSRSRPRPRSQEQLLQLERDLDGEALRTQLVDLPRRLEPDQGGRRGGDLGRRRQDAPLRPGARARTSPSTASTAGVIPNDTSTETGGRAAGRDRHAGRAGGASYRTCAAARVRLTRRGAADTLTPPMNAKPRIRTTGLFSSSSGGVDVGRDRCSHP